MSSDSHTVVDPAERTRLRLAATLFDARLAHARALLSDPPLAQPIALALQRGLQDKAPVEALTRWTQAAKAVRDRAVRRHLDAFETATCALADVLIMADPDRAWLDSITADLERMGAGYEPVLLGRVRPRHSARFDAYLRRIRDAREVLTRAKRAFVLANLRLVWSVAKRYLPSGLPLEDLAQEGYLGLMKAADRFDPRRGVRFSTYGVWWIRHAISRAIANGARQVRVPVHVLDVRERLRRFQRTFMAAHGREPTDDDLSELGVSAREIARARALPIEPVIGLDHPIEGVAPVQLLPDATTPAPDASIEAVQRRVWLRRALEHLRPLEADILRKRFGLQGDAPMTLAQIGAQYRLSRERIRQLEVQALTRLRRRFGSEAPTAAV
jgi:RNA polymerase primary sigma factor